MGSLFRSEEMTLAQLFLQSEAAYACVSELGELGLVQFRDLNPDVNAFQRKFVNEVRRCDEMERKLRFLEKEIRKAGIPIVDTGENPDAPPPREMIDLEATFEKLENEMKEVNTNQEALKRNFLELTELKHILRKTQSFFEEESARVEDTQILIHAEHLPDTQPMRLGFVAGVINRERLPTFERMLWRACRGNVFLRQTEIETPLEDPVTGDQVHKCVFIIFFQGDQLKTRVKKICEGFRATLYPCPETPAERREMAIGVMTRIEDLQTVLNQTQDHRHRVLVSAAKNIRVWFIKARKIKAIYHTLNLFNLDVTQKCLIAECWCPVADLERIQLALRRGTEHSGSSVPSILNRMTTKQAPPTYHKTNKFTSGFQALVDSYGVASYCEVNPAPFTIITFPFLFAVMFGDAGHGLIMALFALWMVWREKQLMNQRKDDGIWSIFFGGRYIILLMGAFSIYTGFIYNDFFSKSLNIFGSSWHMANISDDDIKNNELLELDPNVTAIYKPASPYPFGIDPIWNLAENKITFLNSFKMKMSVTLGVIQMSFGVCLSLSNYRFFKDPLSMFSVFIPQLMFLMCIFGYMVIIIFFKWIAYDASISYKAPSLLITMINMFLFKFPDSQDDYMYSGQKGLQIFLVLVAVACVPCMLFIKPYFEWRAHKSGKRTVRFGTVQMQVNGASEDTAVIMDQDEGEMPPPPPEGAPAHKEEEEFDIGEILIHQAIHTIEFCLGCISHTASYLRLWALSLAHAQLSEVLWSMVLHIGLGFKGWVGAVVTILVFPAFAVLTVAILLVMEGLSAFLHALRLHWVEFQSKFYKGEGHQFVPFSFEALMEDHN
ncbi:PREDICTED: V-type proton ATPase 116 kDa subunit a-like isoform X5 [Branchiostoma belcheri]|uniref:V-type proton ATPase subunit a n=1 Tax=Branchiostoma belcheri TaxID=7741 RepID=A0A6P4Y6R2_BRABE|nr:PREDICTED: V-type proton ATPase 116 kDa subunit a-like isoform X5 [Branchiostoma belcheri]